MMFETFGLALDHPEAHGTSPASSARAHGAGRGLKLALGVPSTATPSPTLPQLAGSTTPTTTTWISGVTATTITRTSSTTSNSTTRTSSFLVARGRAPASSTRRYGAIGVTWASNAANITIGGRAFEAPPPTRLVGPAELFYLGHVRSCAATVSSARSTSSSPCSPAPADLLQQLLRMIPASFVNALAIGYPLLLHAILTQTLH
eukprot:1965749-Pyramimonas_sp.AAC.1